MDSGDDRLVGVFDQPVDQIVQNEVDVRAGGRGHQRQQRTNLRTKRKLIGPPKEVKRLDAGEVSGKQDGPLLEVEEREREHPGQPRKERCPLIDESVEKNFRVGPGREDVSLSLQRTAQLKIVVNLAVEGDGMTSVSRNHRLPTCFRQVENRQPPMCNAEATRSQSLDGRASWIPSCGDQLI